MILINEAPDTEFKIIITKINRQKTVFSKKVSLPDRSFPNDK
jgi:hypothetical protein